MPDLKMPRVNLGLGASDEGTWADNGGSAYLAQYDEYSVVEKSSLASRTLNKRGGAIEILQPRFAAAANRSASLTPRRQRVTEVAAAAGVNIFLARIGNQRAVVKRIENAVAIAVEWPDELAEGERDRAHRYRIHDGFGDWVYDRDVVAEGV